MADLVVWLDNVVVGRLSAGDGHRIMFRYDRDWVDLWRSGGPAHAISLSLPVSDEIQDATAFAAGLLPDSVKHRNLIAAELGIDDDPSDFAFLAKLGRDCAGALIIVPEEQGPHHAAPAALEELDEAALAEHLRNLPRRPLMVDEDEGITLSLAGVNDKAAVVLRQGRMYLPLHGYPSTHIIKVDIPTLKDSIKTEHFCLRLADAVGLRVPKTQLHMAEDQSFMLMSRYDRYRNEHGVRRRHQEDFCQALGYMPGKKYERHGGPGWRQCFGLMAETANPVAAREELLRYAVFQFLINNPDAHAKNYSLLFQPGSGSVSLAPIYDLNNAAAFAGHFKKTRPIMAMWLGGEGDPTKVTREHWDQFAVDCRLSQRLVGVEIMRMAAAIQTALDEVASSCPSCDAIDLAVDDIRKRAAAWA